MPAAELRALIETRVEERLAGRFPAPLGWRPKPAWQTAPTGIPEVDALTGGLPQGALTEICGPGSSGRTALLLSLLSEFTRRQELCALVAPGDGARLRLPESGGRDRHRQRHRHPGRLRPQPLAAFERALPAGGGPAAEPGPRDLGEGGAHPRAGGQPRSHPLSRLPLTGKGIPPKTFFSGGCIHRGERAKISCYEGGTTMPRTRAARSDSTPPPAKRPMPVTASSGNLEEEIRRRAYELYELRNGTDGSAEEDWIRAEREVLDRSGLRSA